jgi:hypothetical protein
MTAKALTASINKIKSNRTSLQEQIHEALISCSFYAMKDGNITPFNQLLDAVGNSTRIKGLTMWAETFAPVLVREGAFAYNKSAGKSLHVTNEEDFSEYEIEMRLSPKWYEIAGEQKAESIFDCPKYLEQVFKRLTKEGQADVAAVLRAAVEVANFKVIEAALAE